MTLSLRSAATGGCHPHRLVGAALLLLALVMPLAASRADDDPYSATVKVDVTAANAPAARDKARLEGQRQALAMVIQRLSGGSSAVSATAASANAGGSNSGGLAGVPDQRITDMVVSFQVGDERMSAVRYQADLTYHFRGADVRQLMQSSGLPIAAPGEAPGGGLTPAGIPGGAGPVVVLPVYQNGGAAVLWGDPNPWRQAWGQALSGPAAAAITVPLADAGDLAVIDAARAIAGNPAALSAIAHKNGAGEVDVALAIPRRPGAATAGVDVTVTRYRAGQMVGRASEAVDAAPGEGAGALLRRAATVVAADIVRGAGTAAAGPPGNVTATVALTSLGDWVKLRRRLTAIAGVQRVDLLSLSQQRAEIAIAYQGGLDQLKNNLATAGLSLVGGDPNWRLQVAGAPLPQ